MVSIVGEKRAFNAVNALFGAECDSHGVCACARECVDTQDRVYESVYEWVRAKRRARETKRGISCCLRETQQGVFTVSTSSQYLEMHQPLDKQQLPTTNQSHLRQLRLPAKP